MRATAWSTRLGRALIVRPADDIDLASVPAMTADLTTVAGLDDVDGLIIDLADVGFIGCEGITMLITVQRELDRRGRWLRLTDIPGFGQRILDLAGLHFP